MKYNPALDGVRAIAVLAVMCMHCGVPHTDMGFLGVDVFFVLSGFLITSILKDQASHGGIRFGEFYLRRVRRLYPALLAMLALYLATFPWLRPAHHVRDALLAATYLSDYAVAFWQVPKYVGHTWSLSVEEHFYLLWPLVVLGLSRIKRRKVVVYLLIVAYIAETFYRTWSDVAIGMWETFYRFDTRLSGLILGGLLAYLPELRHRAWAWAVLPLAVLTWWTYYAMPRSFAMVAVEGLSAALILWAAGGSRVLAWKPLVYIGGISYGLYLYHAPIAWIGRETFIPWQQQVGIVWISAFLLAHYSAKYIEAPFRRPRRQATTASIAVRIPEVSAL